MLAAGLPVSGRQRADRGADQCGHECRRHHGTIPEGSRTPEQQRATPVARVPAEGRAKQAADDRQGMQQGGGRHAERMKSGAVARLRGVGQKGAQPAEQQPEQHQHPVRRDVEQHHQQDEHDRQQQ